MGFKTFFQPWLIQPTFPTFVGSVTEYDPLQDAYDLSVEATGWVQDVVDQLTYANELYLEAANDSKDEIARHKDRRSVALDAISINKLVMQVVSVAIPPEPEPEPAPVAPEPDDVVITSEPEVPVSEWVPTPWQEPTAEELEPVEPKRRRRKKEEDTSE